MLKLNCIWLSAVVMLLADPVQATTDIYQEDFRWGTYIIDQPGRYRLAQDISFAPNSVETLSQAIADGSIPPAVAHRLGLPLAPNLVPAAASGSPLATQFKHTPGHRPFTPGGPLAPNYDPAAYGLGFFAAIVITADNVVLDLGGHRIEQSPEHALLQRFFSVIELAERPFIPKQGPANFGETIKSARNVVIHNGQIGRSAHHGIHGNGNRNVVVANVDFVGYEVAALALNGVRGLLVTNSNATNRKDVPVLGTFSAAWFIRPYLQDLVQRNASTRLKLNGRWLVPAQALKDVETAINRVYADVISTPIGHEYAQIDATEHPQEYALFHNPKGLVDGNSYSFLVNNIGVAVNGFPTSAAEDKSRLAIFHNVQVHDQQAFVNEIVAVKGTQGAATDPIGALWQIHNTHPDSGLPLTSIPVSHGYQYKGNVLANAQALVAKAIHQGDFSDSRLDVSRNSITPAMIRWVEADVGYETLSSAHTQYLCNGDSMFHVNKGVIGYNVSAVGYALLSNTSVRGLTNFGTTGSSLCGDYSGRLSHPQATLLGYGGAAARGYAIAGANRVSLRRATATDLTAVAGNATGVDILTDSKGVSLSRLQVQDLSAGLAHDASFDGPNPIPTAAAVRISHSAKQIRLKRLCTSNIQGYGGAQAIIDHSNKTQVNGRC